VPINDYATAHEELANLGTETYFSCCGKSICIGCIHSFNTSGNSGKCVFCNDEGKSETDEELFEEMMKRVHANDAGAMFAQGCYHSQGLPGLQQDRAKAMKLWTQAARLGSRNAHYQVGVLFDQGGDMKKAKFHFEAAAMAGNEMARYNLGCMELH
jgi:hypothetical protein